MHCKCIKHKAASTWLLLEATRTEQRPIKDDITVLFIMVSTYQNNRRLWLCMFTSLMYYTSRRCWASRSIHCCSVDGAQQRCKHNHCIQFYTPAGRRLVLSPSGIYTEWTYGLYCTHRPSSTEIGSYVSSITDSISLPISRTGWKPAWKTYVRLEAKGTLLAASAKCSS